MRKSIAHPLVIWSRIIIVAVLTFMVLATGCKGDRWVAPTEGKQSEKNEPALSAQEKSPALEFAETITLAELKEHIAYLASDKLEGRFSCTAGAHDAAVYITQHFQELELKGLSGEDQPYFQEFQMQKKQMKENYIESEHSKVENWIHFGERFSHFSGEKDVQLIFAGFGRDDDLEGIKLQDKLVAFFPGGPDSSEINMDNEKVKMDAIIEGGAAGFLLIFTDESSRPAYARFRKAYFGDVRYYLYKTAEEALNSERSIVIFASDLAGLFGVEPEKFLAVQDEMKSGRKVTGRYSTSVHMKTSYDTYGTLDAKNALAYIEGTDKKDEWIILTAHYDHLGKHRGDVYNGADDNASGVAALLEMAEAFELAVQDGKKPRRSILFLAPDAEEIGANGSLYYVENPLAPLSNTVVDMNIDAIGRDDAQRPDLKDFVYVYCSQYGKADLNRYRTEAEETISDKLRVEIKATAPGSDNYMFEREGVPVIAYTTGHSRDYHKPSDTKDKLNYKNLHRIVRMAFVTIWEIANGEDSIHRTTIDH